MKHTMQSPPKDLKVSEIVNFKVANNCLDKNCFKGNKDSCAGNCNLVREKLTGKVVG